MSADLLRRAAALIRHRARDAEQFTSPWHVGPWDDGFSIEYATDNPSAGLIAVTADYLPLGAADHIASWHPSVALAVAVWLDTTARDVGTSTLAFHAAAAVARAYLGEAS